MAVMRPKFDLDLGAEKWEFSQQLPVAFFADRQAFHFGPSAVVELETAVGGDLVTADVCRGTELAAKEFFFVYFVTYVVHAFLHKNNLMTFNHLSGNKLPWLKLSRVHVAQQPNDKPAVIHIINGVERVRHLFFA
jgi:hypothetical protein